MAPDRQKPAHDRLLPVLVRPPTQGSGPASSLARARPLRIGALTDFTLDKLEAVGPVWLRQMAEGTTTNDAGALAPHLPRG